MSEPANAPPLSIARLVRQTLLYRWGIHIAVILGVAVATAVIAGALLVGDSMRGSLRGLTLERLGKIDSLIAPGGFFRFEDVAGDQPTLPDGLAVGVIYFPGASVEIKSATQGSGTSPMRTRRSAGVQILGIEDDFWQLESVDRRPSERPGDDSVLINQAVAEELDVKAGDEITLRLPVETAIPADSPLGKKEIETEGLPRMRVAAVLPNEGLARFALSASQTVPRLVFANRATLADVLDRDDEVNTVFFSQPVTDANIPLNLSSLTWDLKRVTVGEAGDLVDPERAIIDYVSLTSQRLLLPDVAVDRIVSAFPDGSATPVMTYLANALEKVDPNTGEVLRTVPYSMISAIDSGTTLTIDYTLPTGASEEDKDRVPLVLNDWTAERLDVTVGDAVRVAYFLPEVERGQEEEQSFWAVVTQIVPLSIPSRPHRGTRRAVFDEPITPFNDFELTPYVPGVTDQASISDWDVPFEMTRETNREDDRYVDEQRLTPKAFLPLQEGRRRFGSRFGNTTGLRFDPNTAGDLESIRANVLRAIEPARAELGWSPISIRSEQLAASRGTTPFDGLFLALSCFVIFSAVMLIAILLRLGVLQRLTELGTLLAVGWTPARVRRLMLRETTTLGIAGCCLGLLGGWFYAQGVIAALRTWWVGAVTVPFLEFHATPMSMLIGFLAGLVVCMATAWWSLRILLQLDPASLLGGRLMDSDPVRGSSSKAGRPDGSSVWMGRVIWTLIAFALIAGVIGGRSSGPAAAGAFVGGGMMLLIAMLASAYRLLRRNVDRQAGLFSLAVANARRNPLRSTMTMGLVATASFLILAITVFRMTPTEEGTGGFELMAQCAQPIHRDLSQPDVQKDLLAADAPAFSATRVVPMRLRAGDDASCNNLYRASQPTVIGIPAGCDMGGFAWMGYPDVPPNEDAWQALQTLAKGDESSPIPVVIDQNTALWSLQMSGRLGETIAFDYGGESGEIHFELVGTLMNSTLQGRLLIAEDNFERVFPDETGYRSFLIDTPTDQAATIAGILEDRLGEIAMDVTRSDVVLTELMAVQNTYLRTFQSLGALGLLLGTVGLAVSQFRNVLQRRGELAVMRAVGFTRGRLANLILNENVVLLVGGVGCGAVAALLAVLPYFITTRSSLPIWEPALTLIGIVLFGLIASALAVLRVVTLPLIASLRADNAAAEL
ncbi:MAG: FtsX-like permease family protein [Planctomycetota bacterium]